MTDHKDLIERLEAGVIEHRKRWSGDTHYDLGGSIDDEATESLMAEAAAALREKQAEIERLREALEIYADPCDAPDKGPCQYEGNMCCMTARAALGKDGA